MTDKSETVRHPRVGDIVHFVLGVEADGQPNANSGRHLAALVVHLYPNPNFSAGEPIPSLRIGVVGVPGCAPINDFVPFSVGTEQPSNLIHDEIARAPGTWHFADDTTITAIAGFDPARLSGKSATASAAPAPASPSALSAERTAAHERMNARGKSGEKPPAIDPAIVKSEREAAIARGKASKQKPAEEPELPPDPDVLKAERDAAARRTSGVRVDATSQVQTK